MPRKWSAELYVSDYKGPSQPTTPTSPASSASNDPFSPGQSRLYKLFAISLKNK